MEICSSGQCLLSLLGADLCRGWTGTTRWVLGSAPVRPCWCHCPCTGGPTAALKITEPGPGHTARRWLRRTRLVSGQEVPACQHCAIRSLEEGPYFILGFPLSACYMNHGTVLIDSEALSDVNRWALNKCWAGRQVVNSVRYFLPPCKQVS